MLEAKRPLQRQLQAELSSCAEDEAEGIRAAFASREAAIEHEIDFKHNAARWPAKLNL